MKLTRVFEHGDGVAVLLPERFALPVGEVMIDERDGMFLLVPLDRNGWPRHWKGVFPPIGELEQPARPQDSKLIE